MTFQKMHLCTFAATAMLMAVGCESSPGPAEKKNTAADTAAITVLRDKFAAAFNSKDAAALTACYTDDGIAMPPNQATVTGKQAIQAYYQATFQQGAAKITITPRETEVSGDWAFETGTTSLTITPKTGKPVEEASRYVVVLKKQTGGFWKIHLDASNSAAPMPAPAAKKKKAATVKGRGSRPKSAR
jgi:uncharacterized protein (TIGR02246 family)